MTAETLQKCFSEAFTRRQNKPAITFIRDGHAETAITYLDLHRDSNRIANMLLGLGVNKGDRVAFFVPNSLFTVSTHIALQKIGAISVHLNPGFKKSEMEYLLHDSDPKLIVCTAEKQSMIKDIDENLHSLIIDIQKPYQDIEMFRSFPVDLPHIEISPDDPSLIIYTSGTTGKPKGAILTHSNMVNDARNIIQIWEISGDDVLCHTLPLFHIHGLCFALHTALMVGSKVLMLNQFNPANVIDALSNKSEDSSCTVFMAVPAMYAKLMDFIGDRTINFDHMRLWTSGSAPLLPDDFARIKTTFGKEPVEREGMSETGMNFSNPLNGVRKPGSIGVPLPKLEVRIVNPDTKKDVEPGSTGEIWLKGPSITLGYWRKPEETAKAFEDGWFMTGDLGHVDKDGYYFLTDRTKHIIISGGENISPKEVESVINRVGGVIESSVVGIPDPQWGEKVVAVVVKKSGSSVTVDEIKVFCKTHLHDWKCPKEIRFVDQLPRNTMGKVLKEEVKKSFGPQS